MMQQVQSISLILTRDATELTQAQCDVVLNGKSTGILVPGHVLEAAVQVNNQRYILFLTDDVIFEESLTIALIDIRDGVKEIIRLGNAYSRGIFEDLLLTADSIHFRFSSGRLWMIKTSDEPRLTSPFDSVPKNVKRGIGLKKYMTLSTSPAN